jgi:hypothetical protein
MTNDEIRAAVAFHNRLRILLHSLSPGALETAGLTKDQIAGFIDHPVWFFTRCDDATAAAILALIEARQPEELKAAD